MLADPSSSFSTVAAGLEGFDLKLEENISSRVLLTEGRVLWDLSQPPTDDDDTLTGVTGAGAMEMDAGVALMAVEVGGWGARGLGALGLVVLAGTGGWDSTASGSLEVMELSWKKNKKQNTD